MAANHDIFSWYHEIPPISRLYLTAAVFISTACFLDFISPLTLYYNYDLIVTKGQYWRIISSFLFFGSFSLDFLFHMYFVVRYCRLLEEGTYRGRKADFIYMLILGASMMLLSTVTFEQFSRIKFLGHPLTFMMVYLWARDPDNYHIRMSFFGVIQFNAPYLPWVLLIFSLVLRNPVEMDLLGIIAGHTYYFCDNIYPQVATIRGWPIKKIVITPSILHYLCSSHRGIQIVDTDILQQAEMVARNIQLNGGEDDRNILPPNDNLHLHQD
mmetsp:Transcript_20943/g.28816  ORF Transcript_20943/g.28816 Transcript_20943/m.28816 type:complete len:269 (-) Transcript_20943:103-909(-)